MQFTVGQVTVQHLVEGMPYALLIMPIRILILALILTLLTVLIGVTDQHTILAGTRYFSPDEIEVFYLT